MKIKFSASHLPRLDLFMAKNDIRYYLCGIYVEKAKDKDGVYLVATDGHTMAVIYDKDGIIDGAESIILRVPPAMVQASKAKSHLQNFVLVQGKRVSIATDFGVEHTELEKFILAGEPFIDAKYPNFHKVLPDFKNLKRGLTCPLNPKYLARLEKLHGGNVNSSVVFWQEKEGSAVTIQHSRIPEMISIIMPMRYEGGYGEFDQFLLREDV